jgi:ribosomal protein S18 acetylase RimI-like enzyme
MIRFELATPADAAALTEVQVRAFDHDARRYPDAPPVGPPGYGDVGWQLERMAHAHYFKILDDEEIVGGAIVLQAGPGHCELGRIWIDPGHQGRGIGGETLHFLEKAFPDATVWTLDTPAWATRNQAFYERHGYRKVREAPAGRLVLLFYEKRLERAAPATGEPLPDPTGGKLPDAC